jgi:2-aminoethylphosphonate-pyruvate transaminase
MTRPYILLTPGPLTTSQTVKEKMLADWCTWDDDYNVEIVQNIRQRLVDLATKATGDYTSVLMQGSGTYAVESAIICSVPKTGKILILANGVYGDRMGDIVRLAGLKHKILNFEQTEVPSPSRLDSYLQKHKKITHVAFVHCETTSGILNPLEELCAVAKKHGKTLIVDAMSSFGGIPFDVRELGIDFLVSSANKCIEGVPGFGFMIAQRDQMELCKGISPSLSLDIYDQWQTMEKQSGKWRFTSPTHTVRAFRQALDELDAEGGIHARNMRYATNQRSLSDGMKALGYTALLPEDVQSPIITSFEYPSAEFSFKDFYSKLKQSGFVIYPGKISKQDTFRIGTIGQVYPADVKKLLKAIAASTSKN